MAAQPIGAYVLVKFPVKIIMPVIVSIKSRGNLLHLLTHVQVFFWGCALCGMAGANNFGGTLPLVLLLLVSLILLLPRSHGRSFLLRFLRGSMSPPLLPDHIAMVPSS